MHMTFQQRVVAWATRAFGSNVVLDKQERGFRFVEEALELAQAGGISRDDVLKLVDYVYNRPVGSIDREIGGTLTTLAVLCEAHGHSMAFCGDAELTHCYLNIKQIQAKHRAKVIKSSPLPGQIGHPNANAQQHIPE